jgi:glucose/arabinose dehydrogenase/chitodextrinase
MPPAAAAGQADIYMSGLSYPIALAFAPDGRIFYAEWFTGNIQIIENNETLPTPFYTLANTATGGERGLLGLALDPEFPTMPYIYAYHTYDDSANGTIYNRIVRILADGNVGVSHTVILRMPPLTGATNHNGGVIAFGPDGMLYAVVGENAIPALSQDPSSPMGKVLRMTREGWAPPDNPFVGDPDWFNLTYTYGHRNMFGLAFHPATEGILVTENGPECNDEVNLLASGENFGWGPNYTCGTPPPPPNNTNQDGPDPVLPIWWWSRTICPTNAAVYAGPHFPAWQGDLFMGDCNFGTLHRLDLAPPNYDTVESDTAIWTSPDLIFDVEVGPDGAIWLTTASAIYRFWDSGKPPIASFTADPNPVVVDSPVAFNASASYDPDGTIVSYVWDFDDGTNATGPTASHIYRSPRIYNVSLTVVDNESHVGTAYGEVIVVEAAPLPPVAAFTANPNRVEVDVPVEFNASASYDPDGTIVSYTWDFDDGTNATGQVVSHSYQSVGTYNVSLTVVDDGSLNATTYEEVVVSASIPGQPPVAAFTASPSPAAPEALVTFNASGSSDPDGEIVRYDWDFGDLHRGEGTLTTHAYESSGTYLIRLTVRDTQNLSANSMRTLVVTHPPRPVISYDPTTIFIGTAVSFDATGSADPDGTIESWTWSFGDGDDFEDMGPRVTHVYTQKGSFTVTLTVQDNAEMTNTTSTPIEVRNRAPRITSPTPGDTSVTIAAGANHTFSISASDPDGDSLVYVWRIDGVAAGENPTLNFQESDPGTYVVNVTVSDGDDSVSREWTVTVPQPVRALGWPDLWPTAALLAAIAGATGFVAWRRHRRRRKEPLPP